MTWEVCHATSYIRIEKGQWRKTTEFHALDKCTYNHYVFILFYTAWRCAEMMLFCVWPTERMNFDNEEENNRLHTITMLEIKERVIIQK